MFTVYVIRSREGHRYIGFTSDLEKRLDQHNCGMSRWTKRGSGWRLVHSERFSDKTEALRRERWLKSGHGRAYLDSLLSGS
jgi:putative endonuclease